MSTDAQFPASADDEHFERLLRLCATCRLEPKRWTAAGKGFFMSGVVVRVPRLAGVDERSADRRDLPRLAERESPGANGVGVFASWLKRRPVSPWRLVIGLKIDEWQVG